MSKYIPVKGTATKSTMEWTWESKPTKKETYINPKIAEKERIEKIPLEHLTFKDIYKFPFKNSGYGRVYDDENNFIFQFHFGNEETQEKCLKILNGELTEYKRQEVVNQHGEIFINGHSFILIRGWGSLTGVGAYNLNEECAAKIQDSLAEFIVEKLQK